MPIRSRGSRWPGIASCCDRVGFRRTSCCSRTVPRSAPISAGLRCPLLDICRFMLWPRVMHAGLVAPRWWESPARCSHRSLYARCRPHGCMRTGSHAGRRRRSTCSSRSVSRRAESPQLRRVVPDAQYLPIHPLTSRVAYERVRAVRARGDLQRRARAARVAPVAAPPGCMRTAGPWRRADRVRAATGSGMSTRAAASAVIASLDDGSRARLRDTSRAGGRARLRYRGQARPATLRPDGRGSPGLIHGVAIADSTGPRR
jgi:hypothetical protein